MSVNPMMLSRAVHAAEEDEKNENEAEEDNRGGAEEILPGAFAVIRPGDHRRVGKQGDGQGQNVARPGMKDSKAAAVMRAPTMEPPEDWNCGSW